MEMDQEFKKYKDLLDHPESDLSYTSLGPGSVINQSSLISGTPYLNSLSFVIEVDAYNKIHPKQMPFILKIS